MAQDMKKLVDKLNDLIALDIDAVHAYESAIKRISAVDVQEQLRSFQQDHERHIRDLSAAVADFGGEPRQRADVKGFFLQAFTAVTSMMGDESALKAMLSNEELTNRTYGNALDEVWPDSVLVIIERNYGDERRHLAYIQDALQNRVWEQTGPQPTA